MRLSVGSSQRRSVSLAAEVGDADSEESLDFRRWHRRMQTQHDILIGPGFHLWNWCNVACKPCRWFDSIDYDAKICKCCLHFRTLKAIGTFVLIATFTYIFLFSLLKDELLPGGTIFFLFLLFSAAYITGFLLLYIGFPPMIGHLLVGILCGNMPKNWLPTHDMELLESISCVVEKILIVIAIIRAGLLLDVSRIKGHVPFILQISIFPLAAEMILVLISAHYLLQLPWEWSAVQGSLLCVVSLASLTSVMEKNRSQGYGENIHLSTVLIAASSVDVIYGIFIYILCFSFIFPSKREEKIGSSVWYIGANLCEQVFIGLSTGTVCGLLAAFFPDKHNRNAPTMRIIIIGLGSFSVASICNVYDMAAAGVLAATVMCLIASNIWEELGWHDRNNPVQYFYTMVYYFGQPVALSLVGFSMNFTTSTGEEIGLSIVVILIGLVGRESVCYLTTLGKFYPTTTKEKLFICIAWFSKGTFQALLALAIEYTTEQNKEEMSETTVTNYLINARVAKKTTVLAILLTTPAVCLCLSLLTPHLLTKKEPQSPDVNEDIPEEA